MTVPEKRGNFVQNVKNCYEHVKFTCHIGNVMHTLGVAHAVGVDVMHTLGVAHAVGVDVMHTLQGFIQDF